MMKQFNDLQRWFRFLVAHRLVSFAALTLIIVSSFAGSLFVSQVLPVHAAQPISQPGSSFYADSNTPYGVSSPAGTTYLDSKWHYIVSTRSASQLTLYIDGVQVASTATPVSGTYYQPTGIAIGRDANSSGYYFNGSLAEVAIYPRALTTTQVATHYAATSQQQTITNPVIFVHGIDSKNGTDCNYWWSKAIAYLHGKGHPGPRFTGPMDTLGYYKGDTCKNNLYAPGTDWPSV